VDASRKRLPDDFARPSPFSVPSAPPPRVDRVVEIVARRRRRREMDHGVDRTVDVNELGHADALEGESWILRAVG
jgi:hypothetical protein